LPQDDLTPSSAGASARPEPLLWRIPPGPARQSIRAWAPRVASAPAR
jgi:hypothetical protein